MIIFTKKEDAFLLPVQPSWLAGQEVAVGQVLVIATKLAVTAIEQVAIVAVRLVPEEQAEVRAGQELERAALKQQG